MFHEIKNSLYQTRNTSYPPVLRTIDYVGIWRKTLNSEEFLLHN